MARVQTECPAPERVVIIGGGFCGLMLAVHLISDPRGPSVTLVERRPDVGRGRAYADMGQPWRLNVCAGNMSAFPSDPGHFLRWLQARDPAADHDTFAERRVYGLYLQSLLAEIRRRPDADRLRIIHGEAVQAESGEGGVSVTLGDGRSLAGDRLVLAVGSGAPTLPVGLAGAPPDRYVADPWDAPLGEGLRPGDEVLLLGSGLTMVDAVLALSAIPGLGPIHVLSRRGLSPRAHLMDGRRSPPPSALPCSSAGRLKHVRALADEIGWRAAVDSLRPITTQLWRSTPVRERRRLLRHLRPWWDVHRHRLAPELAERIEALRAAGRLRVDAGRLIQCWRTDSGVGVAWRKRGGWAEQRLHVRRIVNCTGLGGFSTLKREPLFAALTAAGRVRRDPDGLGVEVDAEGRLIGEAGGDDRIFALGPLTQGAFWEATAVPDLRNRALLLAERLRRPLS